ncbi:hypothetical protein PPL_01476 [Heterostelium album PN500]|uniref:Uncharacterized protein n=1 Tax=Heterostelium pallidum (strain ATCC 26659 / Pp 5 / PN500) TaxID=670386 RepID=D3AZD6_HETP5|nr:hypothetical protein PPL_01476 [Heterostelium album PN500]EFA85519.1 hypothetical protein PPL_01476 [Heterostelium album PN500]|eukprot:XP_020437627.1 hypothetical protein PPL_01476 [Heterostelium album PN500]
MSVLDIGSLYSMSLVSTLFNDLSNDFEIWKPKCRLNNMKRNYLEKITLLTNPQTISTEKQTFHQLKSSIMTTRECRFYTDDLTPYSDEAGAWKRLYNDLGSILFNNSYDLIASAIESSSCDSETQDIENTLVPNKKFWSSKGSNDISSSEYLIYKLEQSVCIVSSVQIHVYKAFFQPSSPIYSPQTIRISVGFSPNNMHFISEEFIVEQTDEPQTFYFDPRLVVGGYIRIDLYGHHQTQTSDGMYYTVIRYVCVDGRSVGCIENKQELCLSMLKFATKHIDTNTILETDKFNGCDNLNQLLSHLKSQMALKLDRLKVYNHVMNSILQDIVEGNHKKAAYNAINFNMRSTKIFNLFLKTSDEAISEFKNYSLYQAYLFTITILEQLNDIITVDEIKSIFTLKSNNLADILVEIKMLIKSEHDFKPSIKKRLDSPLNSFFAHFIKQKK